MSALDDLSDEVLVTRIQAGDQAALRALSDRYVAKLRGRIENRLLGGMRRKVAASDILQEAQLVALQGYADFENRGEGSFERWFGKIVEMKIRESVRRHLATAKRSIGNERSQVRPGPSPGVSGHPSPSQVVAGKEFKSAAQRALEALPDAHREVLNLLQEQQLTLDEAASVMNRSKEATKKLYGRALARLEELMGLAPRSDDGRRRPTR